MMHAWRYEIVRQIVDAGFQVTYHSTAITLLGHPEMPGLEIRVGTVNVIAERDGKTVFRTQRHAFDLGQMLEQINRR